MITGLPAFVVRIKRLIASGDKSVQINTYRYLIHTLTLKLRLPLLVFHKS